MTGMKQDRSISEIALSSDVFFDYCHFQYDPPVEFVGKWRSSYLLENSFQFMQCDKRFYELVETLQSALGSNTTVWGVKKVGSQLYWEFYFYNYGRQDTRVAPSKILEALHPYFRCEELKRCDQFRYFMFSIDILPTYFETKKLDGLHLYIHDVEDRPTGLSYLFDGKSVRLENHYAFYRPHIEWKPLAIKVLDSAVLNPSAVSVEEILIPELVDCYTICVANKQDCDAVYFSRINIDQFLFFLKRFDYPPEVTDFIEYNRSHLDHLLYDVGFDYRSVGDKLVIKKSGYYGTF